MQKYNYIHSSTEKVIFFPEYYSGHFVVCWQLWLAAQNIFFVVFHQYLFNQEDFFILNTASGRSKKDVPKWPIFFWIVTIFTFKIGNKLLFNLFFESFSGINFKPTRTFQIWNLKFVSKSVRSLFLIPVWVLKTWKPIM